MRIEEISMPVVRGKPFQQALNDLYQHCYESSVLAMRMNNEIEDLKKKVAELQQSQ